jgi:AraC-like DNA-binding protein
MSPAITRLRALICATLLSVPSVLRAETVYEFAAGCHEDELAKCFDLIRAELDRLKAKEQGRSFCLPRAWGLDDYPFSQYPLSVLEHIRLSLSAARFGNAERPVDDAISEILAKIYPCN